MDLVTLAIGAAIAIPSILVLQYFAKKYGDNRAAEAREVLAQFDPREPDHVQAWGSHGLGFYSDPAALVAIRRGEAPRVVDPAVTGGWYVGEVSKDVLSGDMAELLSTEDNTISERTASSKWVLIYDREADLLAQVGYMNSDDGETMTGLLDVLLPGQRMAEPGKLPTLI